MQTIDYKAIARRFRPQVFTEVTGQDVIVKTLINAIKKNKVSHAYLFCGIRGTGKTTLARLFAKALNCEHLSEACEPCNECSSCREIASGHSLEVIEIDGASNRGIDDIRNINETLGYAAPKGHYKIFIIDEVHMLTKEAFNALLKSLEEPPKNVKFFFATTEPQKVLPTIISRCQRFDLRRIERAEIIKKLRTIAKELDVEVTDDAFALIARLSEGSLRDGESLFDQLISLGTFPITSILIEESLGFATRKELFEFDEAYQQGDMTFAFDLANKLFTSGRDFFFFIENLLEHYRNIALIFYKKLQLNADHFTEEETQGYTKACKIYEREKMLYIIDYLADLLAAKNRLTFKKIHLEMTLLHILQSKSRVSIDQIVAKLSQLEQGNFADPAPVVEKAPEAKPSEPVQENMPDAKLADPAPVAEKAPEVKPAEPVQENMPDAKLADPAPVVEKAPEVKPAEPVQENVPDAKLVDPAPVAEKAPEAKFIEKAPVKESISIEQDMLAVKPKPPENEPVEQKAAPAAQAESGVAVETKTSSGVATSVGKPKILEPCKKTKQETIMRFAQVALDGVLKKNL